MPRIKKSHIEKKKRNRKKQKKYGVITVPQVISDNDNIIIHIPIKVDKYVTTIEKTLENSLLEYSPSLQIPEDNDEQFMSHKTLDNKAITTCSSYPFNKNPEDTGVQYIMKSFKGKEWLTQTHIYCWWCSQPFDNTPIGLPITKDKTVFNTIGCFCSTNCAASYNFNTNFRNDQRWERYNLLNELNKQLYGSDYDSVKCAPPRESLQMFGGTLSIEKFREISRDNNRNIIIYIPPMVSTRPIQEEIHENTILSSNGLLLKRAKPIINKTSTLSKYMKLNE